MGADARHEVSFELDRDDLRRLNRYVVSRHHTVRRVFLSALVIGPGIAFGLLLLFGYAVVEASVVALLAIPAAAGVVLWRLRRQLAPVLEVDESLIGGYTVRIDPGRIRVGSPRGATGERWEDVVAVGEDRHAIHVVLEPLKGFTVPKRAFATPEEAESFSAAARRFHRDASAGP